jgi:polyhydroxyalkanoate synthesis regulator phasin
MIVRWVMFVVLLLLLAGCGAAPVQEGVGNVAALGERAQGLIENQLADIETAVEANDFDAARTAFNEFQTAFEGIEANVEAAAPEAGEAISTAVSNLETELNAEMPNAAEVNEQLGALRQELESLVAGSN